MTAPAIVVQPQYFQVGSTVYKREENSNAGNSAAKQIDTYFGEASGAFRDLKVCQQAPDLINGILPFLGYSASPALAAASKICKTGWMAMGVPRAFTATYDAYDSIKKRRLPVENPATGESQAQSPAQKRRKVVEGVSKATEAVAMWSYVGSLFSSCANSTASLGVPLKNVGDSLILAHDACDFATSVSDTIGAHKVVKILTAQGQTGDNLRSFSQSRTYSGLMVGKTAAAVLGSIGAVAALLGLIKITGVVAVIFIALSLTASIFSIASSLYKQNMAEKPIKMTNGYDVNRPALPPIPVLQPALGAAPAA